MTEAATTLNAPRPPLRRAWLGPWLWPALALGLALASLRLSALALLALIGVVVVAARSVGRMRYLVAIFGGAAALGGLVRFTLEWAVPNIVSSGQFAAEERAVSRLREIRWAEEQVRGLGWIDTDGDGQGEYALLGELADKGRPRSGARVTAPMLRPTQFHALSAGATTVYRSEGYCFAVYLPGAGGGAVSESGVDDVATDGAAATRHFVAYAWPAERSRGGVRAFYIDEDDRICETPNLQGYSGAERIPTARAALAPVATGPGSEPCAAVTEDGGSWRPWKNKKPRSAAR